MTRALVEAIQQDEGSLEHLAFKYGLGRATVGRIRSEFYGYVPPEEEGHATRTHVPWRKPTQRLTEATRRRIAFDPRPQGEVAVAYNVSIPYVAKLRAKYGTVGRVSGLPEKQRKAIVTSEVSDEALAEMHRIPLSIVRKIRNADT